MLLTPENVEAFINKAVVFKNITTKEVFEGYVIPNVQMGNSYYFAVKGSRMGWTISLDSDFGISLKSCPEHIKTPVILDLGEYTGWSFTIYTSKKVKVSNYYIEAVGGWLVDESYFDISIKGFSDVGKKRLRNKILWKIVK